MWKWVIGIAGAMVVAVVGLGVYLSGQIYLRPGHTPVTITIMARRFSPDELRADFSVLTAMIEHVHPDIRAIVDAAAYARKKDEILSSLDHPMTRIEFARLVSSINGMYQDGHTGLRRPQAEWEIVKAREAVIPLRVSFDDEGATILRAIDLPEIPVRARLVSINGVLATDLRDWMTDRVSGEALPFRRSYAAERFASGAWQRDLKAPFTIKWRTPNSTSEFDTVTPGVNFERWESTGGSLGTGAYRLGINGEVALLVINTLDGPLDDFKSFLKSAFRSIQDQRVTSVVLDLRQNTGGDSRQGDLLQSFLSDEILPALAEVAVKATPEVKLRYKTLMPDNFRWIPLNSLVPMLRGIQSAPDNGFYRFHPDPPTPKARWLKNPLVFHGDLYVLISQVTYSSAVIFAQPFKYWRRATFIGEATGEPLRFYGDNYEFELPNTELQASVSHKQFSLLGARDPNGGIEPDICTTDRASDSYQLALGEIARRRPVLP
jgi:peptidase S41-like protein